jgi:hypothetical protein
VILFLISIFFLIFYREKKAKVIEQGDEMIRIQFIDLNNVQEKKIMICTDDSHLKFIEETKEDFKDLYKK